MPTKRLFLTFGNSILLSNTAAFSVTLYSIGIVLFSSLFSAHAQLSIGTDIYIDEGAELHIATQETRFHQGMLTAARGNNYGLVSFAPQSTWTLADHNSHVDGFVRMHSNDIFSFPIGNQGIIQPIQIERINPSSSVDISLNYSSHTNLEAETGIELVSDEFYWEVKGSDPAYISLSWNAFSNIDQLTENEISLLGIAGYDGSQWRTIESEVQATNFHDNSPSTLLSGAIRSKNPIYLEGYTALTLVRKSDGGMGVNVSQGFSPNGNGINDTWYIENIENFPNAHIIVFNRWERVVFEAKKGYKNDWNGIYSDNKNPLPDGSYAYVIDLEGDGKMDLSGWIYITR